MRLILSLKYKKAIPHKIIGRRRGHLAIYIVSNKKLVLDITNKEKRPTIVISVDITNCYDWIVYPRVSLTCQHFGLSLEYLLLLFGIMKSLKMFLRTSYRVSSKFYTGTKELPFQGGV